MNLKCLSLLSVCGLMAMPALASQPYVGFGYTSQDVSWDRTLQSFEDVDLPTGGGPILADTDWDGSLNGYELFAGILFYDWVGIELAKPFYSDTPVYSDVGRDREYEFDVSAKWRISAVLDYTFASNVSVIFKYGFQKMDIDFSNPIYGTGAENSKYIQTVPTFSWSTTEGVLQFGLGYQFSNMKVSALYSNMEIYTKDYFWPADVKGWQINASYLF